MSASGLIFLLIWGLLIVLVFVLLWHPQRSQRKANTPTDRQPTSAVFLDDDRYWYRGFLYNIPLLFEANAINRSCCYGERMSGQT